MERELGRRFEPGRLLTSYGAAEELEPSEVYAALARHCCADWGECCPDDWARNDGALVEGGRLFSVYRDRRGRVFWVITEADRSATTVLLPEEY